LSRGERDELLIPPFFYFINLSNVTRNLIPKLRIKKEYINQLNLRIKFILTEKYSAVRFAKGKEPKRKIIYAYKN